MPYSEKMASKSTSFVLDVTNDDPSTSHGMTNVLLRLSEYTSPISSSGEVSKILPVNGDQGLVALARSQVACRSGEDAPQRLSCLLPHIMDWHACKVNLILSYPHPRYGDIYLKNVNTLGRKYCSTSTCCSAQQSLGPRNSLKSMKSKVCWQCEIYLTSRFLDIEGLEQSLVDTPPRSKVGLNPIKLLPLTRRS